MINIFRHIMAFIAALAIANPVCCCYALSSDDSPQPQETHSCCSSQPVDSDQQNGGDPCPNGNCSCKDKLKVDELKHVDFHVQLPKLVKLLYVEFSLWKSDALPKILPNQRIYQNSSPPPPLSHTIVYSVFRI